MIQKSNNFGVLGVTTTKGFHFQKAINLRWVSFGCRSVPLVLRFEDHWRAKVWYEKNLIFTFWSSSQPKWNNVWYHSVFRSAFSGKTNYCRDEIKDKRAPRSFLGKRYFFRFFFHIRLSSVVVWELIFPLGSSGIRSVAT